MPVARMENGGIPSSDDVGAKQPGNGSSIAGLCLIGAGALLLSMGVTSVAASSAATAAARRPQPTASTPCPPAAPGTALAPSVGPTTPGAPSAPPPATAAAIGSAPAAAVGSAAEPGSAPAAGSATEIAADAPLLVIHFVKKEVIPQKDDIAKLAALGAKLVRRETVKIVLEGFGDEVGKDEATKGLGRRRGTVLKRTLADVGIALERVTIVPFDVADAAESAGTVRLRTLPPVPAADLK